MKLKSSRVFVWTAGGAPDRKDGAGSGLDFGLSGCNSLQTELRPPPCEDGLPREGRGSPTEEGQLGANKGSFFYIFNEES